MMGVYSDTAGYPRQLPIPEITDEHLRAGPACPFVTGEGPCELLAGHGGPHRVHGTTYTLIATRLIPQPARPRLRSIDDRFHAFHARHPEVYAALLRLANDAWSRGRHRASIDVMFGALRWERFIEGLPDPAEKGFKLNDHFRSRYARLLMAEHPHLAGLFETRTLRSP